MTTAKQRIEHDLLGDRPVPEEAYYGVHTLRAVENFPITATPISIYPDLLRALACIKQAAAEQKQPPLHATARGPPGPGVPARSAAALAARSCMT